MATFPTTFRSDSERIHSEHRQLLALLAELAAALEAMGPSTLSVDPLGTGRVRRSAIRLQDFLPAHFRREEATLFDAVAPVSPELAEFARQMRREHQQFSARVAGFTRAVAEFEGGDHGGGSVTALKEAGEILAQELASHIALEEQQLDGFL